MVHPEFRRQGIGRELVRLAEQWLLSRRRSHCGSGRWTWSQWILLRHLWRTRTLRLLLNRSPLEGILHGTWLWLRSGKLLCSAATSAKPATL
jgi:GNAT superfamily N-acetyltransferase